MSLAIASRGDDGLFTSSRSRYMTTMRIGAAAADTAAGIAIRNVTLKRPAAGVDNRPSI